MDSLIQTFNESCRRNPVFTLVVGVLLLSFVIDVFLSLVTGLDFFVLNIFDNQDDVFMDHFNSMMYSMDDPYGYWKVIYPPLITAFYGVLGWWCLPYTTITGGRDISYDFRESEIGMMTFAVSVMISIFIMSIFVRKVCEKELGSQQTSLLFFLVLVSTPLIYAIARGNSMLICVAALMLFMLGYQSENKWIRYLSYVALGVSAGVKITTVFFGLLVIRRRNWNDVIIAIIIVAAVFLLPFLYTGGSPMALVSDIFFHTNGHDSGTPERTVRTFLTTLIWLDVILPSSVVSALTTAVTAITILLAFLAVILDKKMEYWMQLFLICCLITVGIGLGIRYHYLVMLIPLAYFLISEKELTARNKGFAIIFILIFTFAPFTEIVRSVPTFIALFWILYTSLKRICQEYRGKNKPESTDS